MKLMQSPEALRAIARMMRQPLYQTDMLGVEALVLDNAADEIEILREDMDELRSIVIELREWDITKKPKDGLAMTLIDYSQSDFQAWCAERERHLEEIRMLKELIVDATIRDGCNKVVYLHQETYGEVPPDRVLTAALGQLKTAIIIGYDREDGYYFASSTGDKKIILWLTQMMANNLMGSTNE